MTSAPTAIDAQNPTSGASGLAIEAVVEGAPVVAEWRELADRSGAAPFLYPEWTQAWMDAFGGARELQLATLRRGGELVGALPLQSRPTGLYSPVNSHTPTFAPVALDAAAETELLDQLFRHDASNVDLGVVHERQRLDRIEATARGARRIVVRGTSGRSPFVQLDGEFEEYERKLSRNRRRGLRRRRKRLAEQGEVNFTVHDGSEGLDSLLAELFAIEASGWKGERGTAIASQPDTLRFYTEVARWAASRGMLRLAFLRLDGKPIACDYAIEHDDAWYTLKAGYDERYKAYGPGALLFHEELAECTRRGVTCVHLLGDCDSFKLSWTDRHHELGWVRAVRPNPVGLFCWAHAQARNSRRRLKQRLNGTLPIVVMPHPLIGELISSPSVGML
jgi:CelD/BcsL family acetyltransferase involved in cellulose biosynthesis